MKHALPPFAPRGVLTLSLAFAAFPACVGTNFTPPDAGGSGGASQTGGGGSSATTGAGGSSTTTGAGGSSGGGGGTSATGRGGTGGNGQGGSTGAGGQVTTDPDASVPRVDLGGRKALFIVSSPGSLDDGDAALQQLLQIRGMTVTFATEAGPASMATGQNVILASGAASATDFVTTFKDVPVPMVLFGNGYFQPMGMSPTGSANKGTIDSATPVTIGDTSTPLTVDLLAGAMINVIGTTRSASVYWGTPGPTAIKVAAVSSAATQGIVFAYEKGVAMPVGTAPARRVALAWKSNLITDLSVDAYKLTNAAIEWTAGAP
jgi:hypothetical protein